MPHVRISDVAREAGVSLGTVSNALNHPERVRPETRRTIQSAIARLGYTPNQSARLLRRGHSTAIGLVVPDLKSGPYLQIANGAASESQKLGYDLLITSAPSESLQRHYLDKFRGGAVAGILVQGEGDRPCERFRSPRIPMVQLGVHTDEPGMYVSPDNRAQGRIVASHLLERGASRIVTIGSASSQCMRLRVSGIRDAVADHPHVRLDVLDAGDGGTSIDGYSLAQRVLQEPLDTRADAIIGLTDVLAAGAIECAVAMGLDVPGDVAIAGCDGNPLAWCGAISLTTCAPTGYEVGRKGVQMLVEAIATLEDEDSEKTASRIERRGGGMSALGDLYESIIHASDSHQEELVRPFLLARASTGGGRETIPELNLGSYL